MLHAVYKEVEDVWSLQAIELLKWLMKLRNYNRLKKKLYSKSFIVI